MRLDRANRSFFTLLGVALAPYLLLGLLGCGVLSLVGYQVATSGASRPFDGVLGVVAIAFVAATALGAVLAGWSVWQQRRATQALSALIATRRIGPSRPLVEVAQRTRIRVEVVEDAAPYSFTYGMLAPRVVVSRGLLDLVDAAELEAVLTHERYHVRNLDPLKVVLARTVPAAFFFLPALRDLRQRYLAARELAADRSAVRRCGRAPLAGALYKVVAGPPSTTLGAAAAIGGSELLDVRLMQLEHGREPDPPAISRVAIAATVLGLLVMTGGLVATVLAAVGPDGLMDDGGGVGPGDVAGAIGCSVWVVVGGVVLYRWLASERA